MSWFGGFNSHKLKSNLKMASQRIHLVNNKMDNMVKKRKKNIAKMLETGKVEKARIMVEHVIRDDFTMEAHELIELLCETVVARLPLLIAEKQCPFDMVNAVSTLIYCARRVQIPELDKIRKQLVKKYGKEFTQRAERNVDACVNERIIHKLSVQPPNAFLVVNYLKEIAKQYGVDWEPEEPVSSTGVMPTPTGFSVKPSPGAGFQNLYKPASQGAEPSFIPGSNNQTTTTTTTTPSTKTQDMMGLPSVPGDDRTGQMIPPQFNQLDKNGDGVLTPDEFNGTSGGGGDNLTIPTIPTAQVYSGDGTPVIPDIPTAPTTNEKDDLLPPPPGTLSGPTVDSVIPTLPARQDGGDDTTTPPSNEGGDTDVPDFDDLQARFNALKGFK